MPFGIWTKAKPQCDAVKRRKLDAATFSTGKTKVPNLAVATATKKMEIELGLRNSSGQFPALSRIHNGDFAPPHDLTHYHHRHLLGLPKTVRNKVWAFTILAIDFIVVSEEDPLDYSEPSLLITCHTIREEARPLFYHLNDFEIKVFAFGMSSVMPWVNKYQAITAAYAADEGITAGPKGVIAWTCDYEPNWENLVDWLKLHHESKAGAYDVEANADFSAKLVSRAFQMVKAYRGRGWEMVELMLPSLRKMLIDQDYGWALAEEVEGNEGEDMKSSEDRMEIMHDDDYEIEVL